MKNFFKQLVVSILEAEAKMVLRKYKPKIVAITGSVGKTSTKDAVYTVLSKFFDVRRSEKSFNSELGVPLTILGLPNAWNSPIGWIKNIYRGILLIIKKNPYPAWLILEVGADKPGDIKRVAQFINPDFVIITCIGDIPVHVEFFDSKEHLVEEKSSLIPALKKDGILILNEDDETVRLLASKTKNITVTCGFHEGATFRASNDEFNYGEENKMHPLGVRFKFNYKGSSLPAYMAGCIGRNHIYSGLMALAVAHEAGVNMLEAVNSLTSYQTPPGRLRIIEGVKNSIVIDDTYNASPNATLAALAALQELPKESRKIAVLGDMLELGKHTEEAHKAIGEEASAVVSLLVVVGMRARTIATGALEKGFSKENIIYCENAYEAGRIVSGNITEGDIVLVKGSQGMRMERVVLALMAHPEKKKELLVRQEKEWLDKP